MMTTRSIFAALTLLLLAACATEVPTHVKEKDLGLLWVKHSAEYEAITRQVYRNATDALPRMVADTSWTAQPDQRGAEDLPPAVILDVDETVINNVSFQLAFEPPFTDRKLEMWDRNHTAEPVPGVVEFIEAARAAGVTPFFLTNRPCEKYEDENELCPQKDTVIKGLRQLGIETEPQFVSLSREQHGWGKEKLVRRQFIAESYRIVMLVGDDLGDFIPCVRKSPVAPCTEPATRASRAAASAKYDHYWGNGWYILPGPMHGSWTTVR